MKTFFQNFSQYSSDGNGVLIGLNQTGLITVLCLFFLLCVFLCGYCLSLYFRNVNHFKKIVEKLDALDLKLQSQEYSQIKKECGLVCIHNLELKIQSQELIRDSSSNYTKNQLDKDELKSRFEKITANNTEVPEKYRHVAQLERSGLGADEIAEILDVSKDEAEQMLSLARLSKGRKSV